MQAACSLAWSPHLCLTDEETQMARGWSQCPVATELMGQRAFGTEGGAYAKVLRKEVCMARFAKRPVVAGIQGTRGKQSLRLER